MIEKEYIDLIVIMFLFICVFYIGIYIGFKKGFGE